MEIYEDNFGTQEQGEKMCIEFNKRIMEGFCKHDDEPSRSINIGHFFTGCRGF
jgi:hypothetical protein